MYKKLSNGISWVLHPFLLPLYLIVVLLTLTVFAHYPANVKFYLLWVVVLYAMIIPLLALGVLRSLGRISDFKVDNRRERLLPLLVGAVCYVLCAITIAKIPSAIFLRKFMIAAACCEVLCFVVSFYWKISGHGRCRGAAGGDERCGRRQHDGAADGRHSLCGCTGLRTPLPGLP